jgi:hypothetical protein
VRNVRDSMPIYRTRRVADLPLPFMCDGESIWMR